jgi:hypothetical protein
MPHFENFYADKLRGALGLGDADAVLDLRGVSREAAAASLQEMLERSRSGAAKTMGIRLSPPPEGGGETLFQPIGKALLEAKKRGWIDRLQDGLGFFVALAGTPGQDA